MGDTDNKYVDFLSTVALKAPITAKHRIRNDLDLFIPKPYLPRALVCPDIEHPLGTQGIKHHDMTVLQRHVSYFDRNDDGIIYPWETYQGLRGLGFGRIFAFLSCIFTNVGFSYPTLPGWIPNPLFPVYIKNIHRSQHASNSATYDPEGRFIPANFENMFSKYARTAPDKFTLRELWNLTEGHRNVHDPVGRK
ncbi:hypothetical protein AQUCO_03400277v1 [Aquilegia coerulea]|uniref:Peroxygenase 3 n=1 Tax=Aquilegia coerulea TaxID=218851 RepID=A0A2G5CZA2_AQUCA|nr:hypothetical protein AQUCO_03400277v1 [Aquilegia coerulea]